ncbi:LOW QUALITY PROTEIN: pimeloyl-ACP methyl ester carboxylesterase [Propionibacteriaceae bacterium ES.041]|nr:LOW QUALITY PROTEIN: pimeloyl-ACP methyl ester carboxylesterase [Propionibacteriaceae bacterium ES.041]
MLLAHDIAGSGPPVLLIHAGVADRRMWAPLLPALGHAFTVVRPDLRGFGHTPLPGERYADADDLAELLDELDLDGVRVVGASLGGRVALELATRHPDRIEELVLLAPAHRGAPPDAELTAIDEKEEQLLAAGDLDGAVALNVRTWLGPDADERARELVAVMQRRAYDLQLEAERNDPLPERERVEVDPSAIAVPTTVVVGGHDQPHFQQVARTLAAEIPGADLVELDWAGHLPSLERPDRILALLLDVLRDDPDVHAP